MTSTDTRRSKIEAFARQLAEEMGPVDASQGVCWLDAIENQAIDISDAVHAELVKIQSANPPPEDHESTCPQCNQLGRYQGQRAREMIGRRGPVTISEPEYFCPCCRKASPYSIN